ncbi:hypothetical protein CPAV1605_1208 [seawater metagenome]|uniref:Prolyl 4-hydroxylase alpha subunit domain-containing protein n=1 Tax=seawater metagenome TaxID=1561972 RepID=A0A5E8CK72_9ZZZZ
MKPFIKETCRSEKFDCKKKEESYTQVFEESYTQVFEDPSIVLIKNFLSDEECNKLIEISKNNLKPSMICIGKDKVAVHPTRTSKTSVIDIGKYEFADQIGRRACDVLKVDYSYLETIQVVCYEIGQLFKPHYDYFPKERIEFEKSQRTDTFFIYLNEDFTDGETEFKKLDFKIRGNKGDALWWRNAPGGLGNEDDRLLHAGLPPSYGQKWGCNILIRDQAYIPKKKH